ncbi:HAD-IA family hydrolase [Nocardiopsis sp. EMB25]|uniref:HAD-IA family hydrolase n=1 Tax=Nocardiopsis sp. EMB25 TaxID=2835867 RepID=UPI0022851BD1|nr:HAD-IA family hydrolase [Nocardiopsis sp. EMB25]MCY9783910.1 HAD-IA family hydrolase [Nocardiopsis sp. EMB25]
MVLECDAVLFDLDGVLVESGPVIERMWRGWAARRGLDPDGVMALTPGRRAPDVVRLAAPELDAVKEADDLEEYQVADPHLLREIAGARALTGALPAGAWAVVTSGSRFVATTRLRAVGVTEPPVLVTADDVVYGKPDPEGYLSAAEALGVPPGRCVVVEDAPSGARAGLAAGMRVVGVEGGGIGDGDGVEFVVADLTALSVTTASGGQTGLRISRTATR